MTKYVCPVCGYTYDPVKGDMYSGTKAGTEFDKLPANWSCPICLTSKERFSVSG